MFQSRPPEFGYQTFIGFLVLDMIYLKGLFFNHFGEQKEVD